MANPWNFGDTIVGAIQANRNRAHETNLTLYQVAQQKRALDALNAYRQQQFELQQAAQEQDMLSSTRDYNLGVQQNFVRDPGYAGPAAGSLATPQGQAGAELGVGDPSRMNRAMGPGMVSLNQYKVDRQYEEDNRMVPTGTMASYFGGRAEVPAAEYVSTIGAHSQRYSADRYSNAQGGATGNGNTGAVSRLIELDNQLAGADPNDFSLEGAFDERNRIFTSLNPAELALYTAARGGAGQQQGQAPMLSEEDRAFLGQMSSSGQADALLDPINRFDAVAQSDAYSAADRSRAAEAAKQLRAQRALMLVKQSGQVKGPANRIVESLGSQFPLIRDYTNPALRGATAAYTGGYSELLRYLLRDDEPTGDR